MLIFGGVKFNLLRAKNYENYMQTDIFFSKHHCIRLHTLTKVLVSTHLKKIRQIGSFPQVGVKKKYLKTPPSYYSIYIYTVDLSSRQSDDSTSISSTAGQSIAMSKRMKRSKMTLDLWFVNKNQNKNQHCLQAGPLPVVNGVMGPL